jgi:hypothetical protein
MLCIDNDLSRVKRFEALLQKNDSPPVGDAAARSAVRTMRDGLAQVWITGTGAAPFAAFWGDAASWRVVDGVAGRSVRHGYG